MVQTVERRILHIIDDIDNVNPTQIAIEPPYTGTYNSSTPIEDYYGGGFGVKSDISDIYRFAKFNEVNYFKALYMTLPSKAIVIDGDYTDSTTSESISPSSINIGKMAGRNASGTGYSICIGEEAGKNATNINTDVLIGVNAGKNLQGYYNVSIGTQSLMGASSNQTVSIGNAAGGSCISTGGTYIGTGAGDRSTGNYRVSIGYGAGEAAFGNDTVSIGFGAGLNVTTGVTASNISIGKNALTKVLGSAETVGCVAIGEDSGRSSSGNYSVSYGYKSGMSSTGSYNIAIGYEAGKSLTGSGGNNICIGRGAGTGSVLENNIIIGRDAGQGYASGTGNILIGQGAKASSTINGIPYGVNDALLFCNSRNNYLIAGNFQTGRVNIFKTLNLTPTTQSLPAYKGDIIYSNASNVPQYYDGSNWVDMGGTSGLTFIGLSDVYNSFVPNTYTGIDYRLAVVSPNAGGVGVAGITFPQSIYVDDVNIWVRNAYFAYRDTLDAELMALEVRSSLEDTPGDSYLHVYANSTDEGGNLHIETDHGVYVDSYNATFMSWGIISDTDPRVEYMRYDNTYSGGAILLLPETTITDLNNIGMEKALVTKEWVESYAVKPTGLINTINTCNGSNGWQNSGVTLEVSGYDKWLDFKTAHARLKASGTIAMNINTDATSATDTFSIIDNATTIFTSYGIGGTNYGAADLPVCTKDGINSVGAKAIVTKEYADFQFSSFIPSATITLNYTTADFVSIPMTSINSGTITTINNMTAGQGMIVYVEKTATGGTGLIFNVTGTPITVLAPTVTGKYSFVISKIATNLYMVSKPAESLGLVN